MKGMMTAIANAMPDDKIGFSRHRRSAAMASTSCTLPR